VTQDGNPADKPEKGEEKKENIYVPSLVEAQAEIAAKRTRVDREAEQGATPGRVRPTGGQRVPMLAEADAALEALYAGTRRFTRVKCTDCLPICASCWPA